MNINSQAHFQILEKEFEDFMNQIPKQQEYKEMANGYFAIF